MTALWILFALFVLFGGPTLILLGATLGRQSQLEEREKELLEYVEASMPALQSWAEVVAEAVEEASQDPAPPATDRNGHTGRLSPSKRPRRGHQ